jgi:hypothetical protein
VLAIASVLLSSRKFFFLALSVGLYWDLQSGLPFPLVTVCYLFAAQVCRSLILPFSSLPWQSAQAAALLSLFFSLSFWSAHHLLSPRFAAPFFTDVVLCTLFEALWNIVLFSAPWYILKIRFGLQPP